MRHTAAETLGVVLETEIIPRLLMAHAQSPSPSAAAASADLPDIDAFAGLAINADLDDLVRVLERNIAAGVPPQLLFARVLAPTARRLGVYWEEDICSFTDVTVALGKLQQLVHRFSAGGDPPARGKTILLAAAPGEQHTLGLAMVADAFRDGRWSVTEDIEASASSLQLLVRRARFDVIGLTVSSESTLETLPALIRGLRAVSMNRQVAVLVGGWVFAKRPELAETCGADATASDGASAVAKAAHLLDAHTARV
ncbi:MAG: cobalamin-dependent protein [Alphaproteobacteria bacterium]|nr:cobalamin-dependent protein [Alphaproteobacteria bacterium]